MTMIERMDALEARVRKLEERDARRGGPCLTPGCEWVVRAGAPLCDNCARRPQEPLPYPDLVRVEDSVLAIVRDGDLPAETLRAMAGAPGGIEFRPAVPKPPAIRGDWPERCVQRAFVDGAKWWQFRRSRTMEWPYERDEMEAEALRRFGETLCDNRARRTLADDPNLIRIEDCNPAPPASISPPPAVPDELVRELEEAAQALDAKPTAAGFMQLRDVLHRVRESRRAALDDPRQGALEGVATTSAEGAGKEGDGAILGTDSGAISTPDEAAEAPAAPVELHLPDSSVSHWKCALCGKYLDSYVGNDGIRVLQVAHDCPSPTPQG